MVERRYKSIRTLRVKATDDVNAIYAKAKQSFTAEDLQQYTKNEDTVPAEQVVAELQALAKTRTN